jgi:hypothetical protein
MVDILLLNRMWAANPTTFNDPFDCYPHVDLTGTYEEARAFMERSITRTGRAISKERQHGLATDIERDGFITMMDGLQPQDVFRESISQFGIVSLAQCNSDILMWSHYAENHTGVCLEFATDVEPFIKAQKVRYKVERPRFRPLNRDRSDLIERVLLYKAKFWEYEHEWRYVRIGTGLVEFSPQTLTAIILGAAVNPQFVEQLKALIAEREIPIALKQASFDARDYKLHIQDIDGTG